MKDERKILNGLRQFIKSAANKFDKEILVLEYKKQLKTPQERLVINNYLADLC